MIDFWEALGRMACDSTLQKNIFAAIPAGAAYSSIGQIAADIPVKAYSNIQTLIAPSLSSGCLSLMAAGELLWALDSPDFRNTLPHLPVLIGAPAVVNPKSPNYYIVLGILIMDSVVRANLSGGPASSLNPKVPALAAAEEAQLRLLSSPGPFSDKADFICASRWSGACDAKLQYWTGHLHTLGLSRQQ